MRTDLTRALEEIAGGAETQARPVAVDRALTRVHRRRAARTAATSVGGLAVVAAVAVAAVALPRVEEPVPPVETPVTEPASWPAVTADGAFECGQPVPRIVDPEGDGDLHLTPPGPLTVVAGEPLRVDAVLVNGTGRTLEARVAGKPADRAHGYLVQAGVVVGLVGGATTDELRAPADLTVHAGQGASAPVAGTTTPCNWTGSPADAEAALPAGDYEFYLSRDLFVRGPFSEDSWSVEPLATVVGGPYAVTIEPAQAPAEEGPPAPPTEAPTDRPAPPAEPGPGTVEGESRPALEDAVITTSGLGPLTVGLPLETNPGVAMVEWDPQWCVQDDGFESDSEGGWRPAYPDQPSVAGVDKPPFWLGVDAQNRLLWLDIPTVNARTDGGVGAGSTVAELLVAHPEVTGPLQPWGQIRVWLLADDAGTMAFTAGHYDPEVVDHVSVISPEIELTAEEFGGMHYVNNCG